MENLFYIPEPGIEFSHRQVLEDPRDGLTLFGPIDQSVAGIRLGAVGTPTGLRRFRCWVNTVSGPIANDPPRRARPPFPGFEAAFRTKLDSANIVEFSVSEAELTKAWSLADRHQRVFKVVDVYASQIVRALAEEEDRVDVWFVVIPEEVFQNCRPRSFVDIAKRIGPTRHPHLQRLRSLRDSPSLFEEENLEAEPYQYEPDFRRQLKAKLLPLRIATQIVRETKIAYREFLNSMGKLKSDLTIMESAIAWNVSTALFYKSGSRPWKLHAVRPDVCYIGLVFKKDEKSRDPKSACCAAQMFLDSGDGVVFKGALGPWFSPGRGDFHLSSKAAAELMKVAINSYIDRQGRPPKEVFIHGRVRFNDDEWNGFIEQAGRDTKIVGVRIRPDNSIRLYKKFTTPILRGLSYIVDNRSAYLWAGGFIPRLQTYPGREVPKPLLIDICRGYADIEIVLADVLALTKLNYNSCVFADSVPVTLKFADAVGEILMSAPLADIPPLPFKFYI